MGATASLPERVYEAASKGDLFKLQRLAHELDLDPQYRNPEVRRAAVDWRDSDGRSSLMVAAMKGRYEVAQELLAFGADVHAMNTRYQNTGTALHEAVIYGCLKLVTLLLNAGASPFLANADGLTAYEEASVRGRNKLMKKMEESALFSGSVGMKCTSYAGLKVSYKPRWVVIVEHMTFGDPPGAHNPARLWIFKDAEACVPRYQCSLAGANVQTRFGDEGCDGVVGLSVAKEPASGLVTPKKDGLWCLLIKPTSTAAPAVQAYYRFLDAVFNAGRGLRPAPATPSPTTIFSLARVPSTTSGTGSPTAGTNAWSHHHATPPTGSGPASPQLAVRPAQQQLQLQQPPPLPPRPPTVSPRVSGMGVLPEEDTLVAQPGESDQEFAARLATLDAAGHQPSATAYQLPSHSHTPAPARPRPASFTNQQQPTQQQQHGSQQPSATSAHRTASVPTGNPFWDLTPEAVRPATLMYDPQSLGQGHAAAATAATSSAPLGGGAAAFTAPGSTSSSSIGRTPSAPPLPASRQGSVELSDDALCIICMSAPRSAGFLHGATVHKCVCAGCSTQMTVGQLCPLCRSPIERIIMSVYD
ncbi:MAG: hypothetical protein WDW38_005978 [Sanguina aurantia]